MLTMVQYNHTLYIIGAASTALEIREVIEADKKDYDCIVNVIENGGTCRYSFVEDSGLTEHLKKSKIKSYIIGFTNQILRAKYRALMEDNGASPVNIIHSTAIISRSAVIGTGNYIAAYAVISSEAEIGNHNIVNLSVTLGHNIKIGDNNIFNPGAKISGCVKIGDRCLFGANSFVYQGLKVCSDCMIDAMTHLNQDLEEPSICTSNIGFKKYRNRFR